MFGQTTDKLPPISRRLFFAALVLVVIGFIITVIGACMPFWYVETDFVHGGVFQFCGWTFKSCSSTDDVDFKYKDANVYDLLWGLTIAGMIILLLSLVFLCTYPCHKTVDYCKVALGIFVCVFLFIGVLLILVALIIFVDYFVWRGADIGDAFENVGWAWYITLLGLLILLVGFICFILHMFFMVYGSDDSVEPTSSSYTNPQTSNGSYYDRQRRY